jgi:hypothetical protein
MSNTCKNYKTDGGDTTVIGGKLEILEGAMVTGLTATTAPASEAALGGVKAATKGEGDTVEVKIDGTSAKLFVPTYPTVTPHPVAANVPYAVGTEPTKAEFDALIDALITAGLMAPAEG